MVFSYGLDNPKEWIGSGTMQIIFFQPIVPS
jgi:hypothetical protein